MQNLAVFILAVLVFAYLVIPDKFGVAKKFAAFLMIAQFIYVVFYAL
ncbi:hypothetical protein [Campylobacter sp.]|nr:hypothetical protein [Campylobacter sp.]